STGGESSGMAMSGMASARFIHTLTGRPAPMSGFEQTETRFRRSMEQLRVLSHALLLAASLVLVSCPSGNKNVKPAAPQPEQAVAPPPEIQEPAGTVTQVAMVNVNLHLDPVLVLRIRHLEGQFLPARKGQPPSFDDKLSYIVAVDSAEVGVSMASMTHAMNTYVFNEP